MSRWHRENPEYYEQYGEPDWFRSWDGRDKTQPDPLEEGVWVCPSCGERPAHTGFRCPTCQASIEYDRLERESNR